MHIIMTGTQPELERMFESVANKFKPKKHKVPKGKAEDGEYCPKKKAGQAWCYLKDTKEEDKIE